MNDENAYAYIGNGRVTKNGKPGHLVNTKEYAELNNVQENTVRVWINRGRVVPVKIGRDNYFFVEDENG